MAKMQEVMKRPERRRREGRRLVRIALGRQSSLFCVNVLFLYLCLLWVYVFYGFYVGPAKLQRGATPPSVMVLFYCKETFNGDGPTDIMIIYIIYIYIMITSDCESWISDHLHVSPLPFLSS